MTIVFVAASHLLPCSSDKLQLFCDDCSGSVLHGRSLISHWFSHGSNWRRAIPAAKQLPCWHLVYILCACTLDNCCIGVVCRKSLFATFLIRDDSVPSYVLVAVNCLFLKFSTAVRFIYGTDTACAVVVFSNAGAIND